ncbi:protein phosphatase 1 regulatory subunit 3G-like [Puntigrus tetrazona]|uniref:protein phosphatase 1 regulatory subunit 3G-like n=1 Tax=Puntigrus tetrazona TaxID=1606681 RepID=UPI001C8A2D62|nr:protein phosphatase 1 regulatory subunit 3G-like [Puntigrus tetrazona]
MDTEQSEDTQTSDETERLSKAASSPNSPNTDRQRAKSLPADLHQHESSSHKEHPARGKRVQFADTMGLNLASVRHFDISDETSGLRNRPQNQQLISARLAPAFEMPVSSLEFDMKSRRLGVALECVTITASEVKGVIRAMQSNPSEVGVRYTLNNWLTFTDVQAALRLNEEKGMEWGKFDFILYMPFCLDKDSSVHFAVYCQTEEGKYWDNNDGQNYTLRTQTT